MMSKTIQGVLTAIVTPFDHDGAYAEAAMRRQVQRQLAAGNGIFCGGTNGEFFVLNEQEKLAVTATCVDEVAGKANVVAHVGEISTRETIRLGKQVAALGVDAVSVITPYFVPLKQSELIAHYTAVADALTVRCFSTTSRRVPAIPYSRKPFASWLPTPTLSASKTAQAAMRA